MDSEPKISAEITKIHIAKDTIRLPFEKNEFIHIQADQGKLAQSFNEFSSSFGVNGQEAQSFFENKVDFKFGNAGSLPFPGLGRVDQLLSNAIGKIQGGKVLGVVVPNDVNGNRFTVCLDTQALASYLPKLKTKSFNISDYKNMTLEQRIASFEQALKSLTQHEFFHITQFMKEPQVVMKASRQVLNSMRLLFTYAATSLTAATMLPHKSNLPIIAATPFVLGAIVHLNKGQGKVEGDVYSAQKQSLQMNLKNPYTFIHERG